ncbi:RICIN domain-containing protein [Streptomyces sp. NPDC060064]|uniref:RICIN domain-containing protein n=1 Tax=Streptomyces sp. NPDC060064 TaxID=3347049 RepID=UPI0036BE4747
MTLSSGKDHNLAHSLREVNDKPALARHLMQLLDRTEKKSRPTWGTLATAAFPEKTEAHNNGPTVRAWFTGENAPRSWEPLKRVLEKLRASAEEITAFEHAFWRVDDRRAAARKENAKQLNEPDLQEEPGPVVPSVQMEDIPQPAPGPIKTSADTRASPPSRKVGLKSRKAVWIAAGAAAVVLSLAAAAVSLHDETDRPSTVSGDNGIGADQDSSSPRTSSAPSGRPTPPVSSQPTSASPARPAVSPTAPAPSRSTAAPHEARPASLPAFGTATALVSVESGMCVDGGVDGNDSEIYQWDCAEGARNQQWQLGRTRDSIYHVRDAYSGKCLGIVETPERLDVVQQPCTAGPAQQWRFKTANTSMYGGEWISGYVINSRYEKCLTLSQASHARRADIGEWDCADGTRHQMFRLRPGSL